MSLETDLQNAISSATALNQNVQGKIDEIDGHLSSAIATQQSQVDSTRTSLTNSINTAIGGLDLRASTFSGWHVFDTAQIIQPACVIGNEWAITPEGTVDIGAEQYWSNTDISNASPTVYDPRAGTYVPAASIAKNPWQAIGAVDAFGQDANGNDDDYTDNGSFYSPWAKNPTDGTVQMDADGNPVPAYVDFPWYQLGASVAGYGSHNPGYYLDDHKIPHFVMRGTVQGGTHRMNRTFVQFGLGNVGSYDGNRRPRDGATGTYNDAMARTGDRLGTFWSPTDAEIQAAIAAGDDVPRQGIFGIEGANWGFGNNIGGGNYPTFWVFPMTSYNGTPHVRRMWNWGRRAISVTAIGVIWMPPINPYTP